MSGETDKPEDNILKRKASEIDLIKEFNALLKDIPWKSLEKLPEKLGKVGGFLGFKPEEVDIATPIRRVVTYMGVVVKRLRLAEKNAVTQSEEIEALRGELNRIKAGQ